MIPQASEKLQSCLYGDKATIHTIQHSKIPVACNIILRSRLVQYELQERSSSIDRLQECLHDLSLGKTRDNRVVGLWTSCYIAVFVRVHVQEVGVELNYTCTKCTSIRTYIKAIGTNLTSRYNIAVREWSSQREWYANIHMLNIAYIVHAYTANNGVSDLLHSVLYGWVESSSMNQTRLGW